MIKMQTKLLYKGPVEKKIAGLPAATKAALTDVVMLWHREMLGKHFDTLGALRARYPGVYAPRTRSYMMRKARVHKHQRLLDWSGHTRSEMLRQITVSGTSKKVQGRMIGSSRALNFSSRGTMSNMRDEITAVNAEEGEAMAAMLGEKIAVFMRDQSEEKVVKP